MNELFFCACLWLAHPGVPAHLEKRDATFPEERVAWTQGFSLLMWGEEYEATCYPDTLGRNEFAMYVLLAHQRHLDFKGFPKSEILWRRFYEGRGVPELAALEQRLSFIEGHIQYLKGLKEVGRAGNANDDLIAEWERRWEFWGHVRAAIIANRDNSPLSCRTSLYEARKLLDDPAAFNLLEWPSIWNWYPYPFDDKGEFNGR